MLRTWLRNVPLAAVLGLLSLSIGLSTTSAAHAQYGGEIRRYTELWRAPGATSGGVEIHMEVRFYFTGPDRFKGFSDPSDVAGYNAKRKSMADAGYRFLWSKSTKTPADISPPASPTNSVHQPAHQPDSVIRMPNLTDNVPPQQPYDPAPYEPSSSGVRGSGNSAALSPYYDPKRVDPIPVYGATPEKPALPQANLTVRQDDQSLASILFGANAAPGRKLTGKFYRLDGSGNVQGYCGPFSVVDDDMRMWPAGVNEEVRVLLNAAPTDTALDAEYVVYQIPGVNRPDHWRSKSSGKIRFDLGRTPLTAGAQQRHQTILDDPINGVQTQPVVGEHQRYMFILD
jgi:hypothetical protein